MNLTPSQAAAVIGCSPNHVRHLIREGKLPAKLIESPTGAYYMLQSRDVQRFARKPKLHKGGWPRGKKRSS